MQHVSRPSSHKRRIMSYVDARVDRKQAPNHAKKFLIVRFAPGSGGKFLATMLQCSQSVHAWDKELVLAKQRNDTAKILQYFASKFTTNFKDWQKNEPEVPYQTDFVSNRFSRGDDITFDQAQELLINDSQYLQDLKSEGLILLISNKSQIPAWMQGRAKVVNILIDSKDSKKWFHKARFAKQFIKNNDNSYIVKQEHENFCSPKRAKLAAQFNNEKIFHGSWHSFAKKYIINDPIGKLFTTEKSILAHPTNTTVENFFFNLSAYLDCNTFVSKFQNLCKELDIEQVPESLAVLIIKHYQSLHSPRLNKTICSGLSYNYANDMMKSKSQIVTAIRHKDYVAMIGDQVASHQIDKFFENTNATVMITDNKITVPTKSNQTILSIAPEFYGIHYMPFDSVNLPKPDRAYNCLINRICSTRQSWFYKLFDLGLDQGFVSFNIDYRMQSSDSYLDKLKLFDQLHYQYNTLFQRQYEATRPMVPFCNFEQTSNIENIISRSVISLVIETYFDDNRAIALSEKIFRALQLPRPFLLFAPLGTIQYLKSIGFRVIDDVVNHSYDLEPTWQVRQSMILEQLEKFLAYPEYDIPQTWQDVSYHNQKLMRSWQLNWDAKILPSLTKAKEILYNKTK